MSVSEEILGFIQGYVFAQANEEINWDEICLMFPDLEDEAIFRETIEEVRRRLLEKAEQDKMLAEGLERKVNEVQFGKIARAIRMWPH